MAVNPWDALPLAKPPSETPTPIATKAQSSSQEGGSAWDALPLAPLGALDTALAIGGQIVDAAAYEAPAAFAGMLEGDQPFAEDDWKDALIRRAESNRAAQGPQQGTAIPGVDVNAIRSLGPSLGFSAVGMGAGLGAGAAALPLAPFTAGTAPTVAGGAASFAAAQRMSENSFVRELYKAANEQSLADTGKPISKQEFAAKQAALTDEIKAYGLWEAVPEAAGNVIGFGILKAPVAGAIGKLFGKNVLTRFAAKTGAVMGSELATETPTQMGQQRAESRAGLTKEAPREFTSPADWETSFKEVAPTTVLQTAILAGGAKGAMALNRKRANGVGDDNQVPLTDEQRQAAEAVLQPDVGVSGPIERTAPAVTPDQIVQHAAARAAELNKKAAGTPDTTITRQDGKKLTIRGKQGEILTDAEKAELDFLAANIDNPEALAKGYGATIKDAEKEAVEADAGTAPVSPPVGLDLSANVGQQQAASAAQAQQAKQPQAAERLVMRADGTPFKTEKAARTAMTNRRLSGHEVVPAGDGFALRPQAAAPVSAETTPGEQEQPAPADVAPVPVAPAVAPLETEPWTDRGGKQSRANVARARSPDGTGGAIYLQARRDADDTEELELWVTRDGSLKTRKEALSADQTNPNLWKDGTPEQKAAVVTLLRRRNESPVGSPERKAIDAQVKAIVTGTQTAQEAPKAGRPARAEGPEQAADKHAQGAETLEIAVDRRQNLADEQADLSTQMLDPDTIEADAERFQFKRGGDAEGVTTQLKGTRQWDDMASGVAVVWEDTQGRRFIVDGHQRLALAKRLKAEGQNPQLRAIVLREADGVTAKQARFLGALKNLQEGGESTSPVDVARVIREGGNLKDVADVIPPNRTAYRDGLELAKLSDDAFGAVLNELIQPSFAAEVARRITDPAEQNGAIQALIRAEPENMAQARQMVDQIVQAGFDKTQGEQGGLFGAEQVADTLDLEARERRAKEAEKAEAERRKRAEAPPPTDFELTGSDLPADANPRQQRLFSRAEAGPFKTGVPVTFEYVRNPARAPRPGAADTFAQRIEPAGRYLNVKEAGTKPPEHLETGSMTFENPLVVEHGDDAYTDPSNWKQRLTAAYGGRTGKALSKAILRDGHDGIVTITKIRGKPVPGEVVDLTVIGKPDTKDLIIQHNLSPAAVLHADRMGGLAVPSMAVTRVGSPLQSFGSITLLGNRDMADPRSGTQVFGGDIYSPRYPEITYRLDAASRKRLAKHLESYQQEGDRNVLAYTTITRLDDLTTLDAFKRYAEKNLGKGYGYDDVQTLAAELLSDVGAEEKLFQGYTYSGNRRYKPHTLDNVVRELKRELRGGEKFNYGAGSVRAKVTPKFRSLADVRSEKGRLVPKANFDKLKGEVNDELVDLASRMAKEAGQGESFSGIDSATQVLQDAASMGVKRALDVNGWGGVEEQTRRDMATFLNKLRNLPTEYFEAIRPRAVDMSEFSVAVVPDNTQKRVLDVLRKANLKIVEYKAGDEAARAKAIQDAATENDLMFSRGNLPPTIKVDGVDRPTTDSEGRPIHPTEAGVRNFWRWFAGSEAVDADGRPLVLYRGDKDDLRVFGREDRREHGLFLAAEKERAAYYGEPKALYATIKRPLDLTNPMKVWRDGGVEKQIIQDVHDDYIGDLDNPETGDKYTIDDTLSALESGELWRMDGTGGFNMGAWRALQRYAERNEFDGLKLWDTGEGAGIGLDYVVFEPTQVKSAAENSGAYSESDPDINASRGTQQGGGHTVSSARKDIADRLGKKAFDSLSDRFVVVKDAQALRDDMQRRGSKHTARVDDTVKGLYDPSTETSYVVAGNLSAQDSPWGVFLHEVGEHYGLERMLGREQHRQVLQNVQQLLRAGVKPVRAAAVRVNAAENMGLDPESPAFAREFAAKMDTKTAREVLAYMVENPANHNMPVMRRIIAAVRAFMRKLGMFKTLNVDDLVALVTAAARKAGGFARTQAASADEMRSQNAPIWYSQLRRAIATDLPTKGPVAQMKAAIEAFQKKGRFKAEELEWSGLLPWLDAQEGTVTRDDILDVLTQNAIEVREVTNTSPPDLEWVMTEHPDYYTYYEAAYKRSDGRTGTVAVGRSYDDSWDAFADGEIILKDGNWLSSREAASFYVSNQVGAEPGGRAKFDSYQIPGGTNYREVLLTLPEKATEPFVIGGKEVGKSTPEPFRSSHFPEPNILAHVRLNDRIDAEGRRVLFVEEVQSDWHQQGRKRGYRIGENPAARRFSELQAKGYSNLTGSERDEYNRLVPAGGPVAEDRLPDAPFKQSWPMLAMKRVLRMAVDGGYDAVAWTTGEQQAERYDLSKQIDRLRYDPDSEHLSAFKAGETVINRHVAPDGLPDAVGKEIADRLLNAPKEKSENGRTYQSLSGLDLKVGGEGMKAFYDRMLPNELNKYVKKWGGKVSQMDVSAGEVMDHTSRTGYRTLRKSVHALEITQAMRESIPEGQPLFSRVRGTPDQEQAMEATIGPAPGEKRFGGFLAAISQTIGNITADSVRQGMFDQFRSIAAYEERANAGVVMDAATSAWKMALTTKNLSSVVTAMMVRGPVELVNGEFRLMVGRKGLIDIFKPLADRGLLRLWEGWAAANRAQRLMAEGRENNFTQAQIDALLDLENQYPEFRTVLDEYQDFNKAVLDMAEAAGVIDPVARATWERNDYVPFYRIIEDAQEAMGPPGRRGIAKQSSGIRTLRGGEQRIGSVLENIVMNMAHLVDASYKNEAMRRTVELTDGIGMHAIEKDWKPTMIPDTALKRALEAHGVNVDAMTPAQKAEWSQVFSRVAPQGPDVVWVLKAGKPAYYRVTDPLLLRSVLSFGPQAAGVWMKTLKVAGRTLTKGVTVTPEFMAANFVRDTLSTWVVSDRNLVPLWGAAKGFVKALTGSGEAITDMMTMGGLAHGFYDVDPQNLRRSMEEKAHLRPVGIIRTLWRMWQRVGFAFEQANRIAIFEATRKKGGSRAEAAFQARDIMDFSMRGDWAAVQFLADTVPFLNARLQGLYKLGRGAAEHPVGFFIKGSLLTAATLMLLGANDDDDRYNALPEWEKDLYWHFWIDDEHFKIPKPFEIGAIFATIPERTLRAVSGRDTSKATAQAALRVVADTFAFNPIPQLFKPVIEQAMNYNLFFDSPIVPMRLSRLPPELQYDPWTSESLRELAKVMPGQLRSPKRLEHLLRGYFGSLSTYLVGISDRLVRAAGDYPERPAGRATDIPLVGRFYKGSAPGQTRYTEEFYNLLDEAETAASAVRELQRQGLKAEANELKINKGDILRARLVLSRQARRLTEINKQIRNVYLNGTMTPEQKRDKLDELGRRKAEIVRMAVERYEGR